MSKQNFKIFLLLLIIVIICGLLYKYNKLIIQFFNNSFETKEGFYENNQEQNVTDNVIKKDEIYGTLENTNFMYNYATLKNGSIQKINEITNQVIDRSNQNSKMLFFNEGLQPVEKSELVENEFNDYGKFMTEELNKTMDYICFTLVNVIPISKLKTQNQNRMEMKINTLYKHPDNSKSLSLSFITVIIHEQTYTECPGMNGEKTCHELTPDNVIGESFTYIDTFMVMS